MTVSSGYENKGYDGDNPVKVEYSIDRFAERLTETKPIKFLLSFFSFFYSSPTTAAVEKYRGYCIDKRKSQIIAVGKMEDIEKCVHFVVSFYGSVYSVSGNLAQFSFCVYFKCDVRKNSE